MAYELDLRIDTAQLDRVLSLFADDVKTQIRSGALNNLAFGIQRELQALKESDIDKPTRFTMRKPKVLKANKRFARAKVETQPKQSDYLGYLVYGGRRKPSGKHIPLPRGIKLNKYGNMPRDRSGKIRLQKAKTWTHYFFGQPQKGLDGPKYGPYGIWRAINKPKRYRRLYLMVDFKREVEYDKQLNWFTTAAGYFEANVSKETERAIKFALSRL